MERPTARLLPNDRLHLQHGPIDLIISAEGDRKSAFAAATERFQTVLDELVAELPRLRRPLDGSPFTGPVAQRMAQAASAHKGSFVTPMAAVAGSVADEILEAMIGAADLSKAAVNNGGDIALHLTADEHFELAMSSVAGHDLGRITITSDQRIKGIATSGRHGRSLSLGIADSVTVLAATAAEADVAATLIANAVDLPDHPAVRRVPARSIDPDSDLGDRLVTTGLGALTRDEVEVALRSGVESAQSMLSAGHIAGAALYLEDQFEVLGDTVAALRPTANRSGAHT